MCVCVLCSTHVANDRRVNSSCAFSDRFDLAHFHFCFSFSVRCKVQTYKYHVIFIDHIVSRHTYTYYVRNIIPSSSSSSSMASSSSSMHIVHCIFSMKISPKPICELVSPLIKSFEPSLLPRPIIRSRN